MAESGASRPQWMDTVTGRAVGITALLAALGGLVNGAIDLYRAIANVPSGLYETTNDELFRRHFNEEPVYSQPVAVKNGAVTVEMMLHVYKTGDVFVKYGDFQQWLPFRSPTLDAASAAPFSLISSAHAQSPGERVRRSELPAAAASLPGVPAIIAPIVIDIDRLKSLKSAPPEAVRLAGPSLEKSFLLAKLKEDHDFFGSSTADYSEIFRADPGHRITKYEFQSRGARNAQIKGMEIIENGAALRVDFSLTSGPIYNQYRGWIQGSIRVWQEKVR